MKWLIETLRLNPEIAIFLVLAVGFWVGRMKIGKFSLGVVTSTLLAGVLIGQLNIIISPHVKSVFFLMFLFAVGYSVGPQFFRGLKSGGLQQVVFATILCVLCLLSTVVVAKAMGLHTGLAAGLLSGACTISAVLGVATDTINQLAIPAAQKKEWLDAMPVAYAVTYLFGTAGSAWILGTLGPKLLRVDLAAECRKLEESMGVKSDEPGVMSAYQRFGVRAFRVADGPFAGKTIEELERRFASERLFVLRVRQNGKVIDARPDIVLSPGATIALTGRREFVLAAAQQIGTEVDDPELLDIPVEILDVVVTNRTFVGKSLIELARDREFRGVYLRKLLRAGQEMPFTPATTIDRGDVLQIAGSRVDTARAAKFHRLRRPPHRQHRPALPGPRHHRGGNPRRRRHPGGQRAALSEHERRRPDRGAGLRLAALGQRDVRPDTRTRAVGLQQRRPQRVHRRGRHHGGAGLRVRPHRKRPGSLPGRHPGDDHPVHHHDLRRQVPLQDAPGDRARGVRGRADDDRRARGDRGDGQEQDARLSDTRSPTPSETRC